MKVSVGSLLALCLVAATSVSGQINPLFLLMGDMGEDLLGGFGDNNGMSLLLYNQLQKKIDALEVNVRSGAIGGCESGVIGPFTPGAMTGTIAFQRPFLGGPAIMLAVSDMVVANPALPLSTQIRPGEIGPTQATVTVTDANGSLASSHVAYMVCPSNSAASANSNSST